MACRRAHRLPPIRKAPHRSQKVQALAHNRLCSPRRPIRSGRGHPRACLGANVPPGARAPLAAAKRGFLALAWQRDSGRCAATGETQTFMEASVVAEIRIEFTRFSAFYSPLIATM